MLIRLMNLERLIAKKYRGVDSDFAKAAQLNPSQISQWRSGYRKIGEKAARKIEDRLGLPSGFMDRDTTVAHAVVESGENRFSVLEPSPGYGSHPIPMLRNSATMAGGDEALHENVLAGPLAISTMFIRDEIKPTRADALRFIHAYGDSMKPTFDSGDILLVDTGITQVKVDGIYVLEAHDRLFVKRIRQRIDGEYEISSDNPTHRNVDVLSEDQGVRLIGRVVWVWNGKKM